MVGEVWSRFRNYLYDNKILRSVRFPGFILSVGNLTWGGTGKTSLVQELSRFLLSRNVRVAILSRGYRRETKGALIVNDGSAVRCSWQQCGDEPYLFASELQDAIVAVAEDRTEAFRLIAPFHPDVIILDDAFQHRKIERDLDIVLVDVSEDLTAHRVIPFGKLREPLQEIARAGLLVLTHFKRAAPRSLDWIEKNVKIPTFHADYSVTGEIPLAGKKIGAFCAIGAPHHFYELLQEQGAELVATKSFRDHHVFTKQEVQNFRGYAAGRGAEFIATTAKDAVRLDPELLDSFVKVIRVKLQIAEESLFLGFLSNELKKQGNTPQLP